MVQTGSQNKNWEEIISPPKSESETDTSKDEEKPNNNDNNTQYIPPVGDDNEQTDSKDQIGDNNDKNNNNNKDIDVTQQKPINTELTDKAPSKVEENNNTQIKDQLPKEDVKISSISGNTAYAGDTIQFKVTGDVKSVEGLEGLNYTLKNGCLTINTAKDEATVITPKVIGENGSTAMTSVTITVLNFE